MDETLRGHVLPAQGFVHHVLRPRSCPMRLAINARMEELAPLPPLRPGRYRHYKGGEYDVVAVARHSGNKEGFSFEGPNGKPITATLAADEDSAPLGLVRLSGGGVTVTVSREAGESYLVRRIEAPGHVIEAPGPVDPDDCAGLIGEQLARGGKNSLFQKILPRFRQFLER